MQRRHFLPHLAGLGLAFGSPMRAFAQPANPPRYAPGFDLQGHRGARGLAPENTLEGFAVAAAIGVSTLELDVGVTRDGEVVIAHDRTLNPDFTRGPDGQYLRERPVIARMTWDELQRYDVGRLQPGTPYARNFPDQVPVDGARIPRLAALFDKVRQSGDLSLRFSVETKLSPRAPDETLPPEAFARAVIAVIRAAGMQHRTVVQSFDWRTLKVVQTEAPEIGTVYLSAQQRNFDTIGAAAAEPSLWTAGLRVQEFGGSVPRMVQAAGGRAWSPAHLDLSADKVREAQALGLQVLPWTVNEPARMGELIDWRVNGLITDRPDLAREEMRRRDIRLPDAVKLA